MSFRLQVTLLLLVVAACSIDGYYVNGYKLSVSVDGDGAGVVSSMPSDLVCSSGACTGLFAEGTRVELVAEARSGAFLGWSQACQGPGACAITMDRDRSVAALFGTPGHGRWVQQVGGVGWDLGEGIAVDGDGNVIAVGTFSDSLQIGGVSLTSAGGDDVFVIKLNGITGDVIWAKGFGGLAGQVSRAVRTDTSNNIYVMGAFGGAVDLGGGELRSDGEEDVFVLKLTTGGAHVWSRRFGGAGSDLGLDLSVRGNAIAISGWYYSPSITIGGSILTRAGFAFSDAYVVTMTTDGDFVWGRSLGGTDRDFGLGVTLDGSGDVVVVGEFAGTVDFGGGPLMAASSNGDAFVAKYAGSNGAHLFSKRYGGAGAESATSVIVDSMDNIIVAGYFHGAVDFGGPAALVAVSEADMFVAKYSLAGAYLWARSFGATGATSDGNEFPRSAAVDDGGDVLLAGQFCGTISFDGAEISSAGECSTTVNDTFVVRLTGTGGGHVSSVRAGSRSEAARLALAADGRLYLVGHIKGFAELGGRGLTPVSGADAFILGLAPL